MPKPDKGAPVTAIAPRFDVVRYVIQGGKANRWIYLECCTWCGLLVWDQAQHIVTCAGKAP